MDNYEGQYLEHLQHLLTAPEKEEAGGKYIRSLFGHQLRADLRDGFPLITTKHITLREIIPELLWMLNGDTNIKYLKANNVPRWVDLADKEGNLGPVYGAQWRHWTGTQDELHGKVWSTGEIFKVDQIQKLIDGLKQNPESRQLIVTAWNPSVLPMPDALPSENAQLGLQACAPVNTHFQVNCQQITAAEKTSYGFRNAASTPKYWIDLQLYQRSAEWYVEVPEVCASYCLLLMMIAQTVNMVPRHFVHTFGDTHLDSANEYKAKQQTERKPSEMPDMKITKLGQGISDFKYEDFKLTGYTPAAAKGRICKYKNRILS